MENDTRPPWEAIDSALTSDRLYSVAMIVVSARKAKIETRDRRDWNWNVACDCHAWVLDAIHDAAEGEHREWLHVDTSRGVLDLQFRMGGKTGVPAKFYRPDTADQPQRTLRQSNAELRAIQQWLALDALPKPDSVLRFAVETGDMGEVTDVTLVQLSQSGEIVYAWPIPLPMEESLALDEESREPGVELSEPPVSMPEEDEERRRREEERRKHSEE